MFIKIKNNINIIIITVLFIINIIICCIQLNKVNNINSSIEELQNTCNEISIKIDNNPTCECEKTIIVDYIENINEDKNEDKNEDYEDPEINKYQNRWDIDLTEEEIELLAKIVYLEAGNQSQEGQMAVVEVIFNRMIDEYYKGTLEEVLSRPRQFSAWKNRNSVTPNEEIYESINMVLNGESNIFSYEVLYFAKSSNGGTVVKKIGDHVFCK